MERSIQKLLYLFFTLCCLATFALKMTLKDRRWSENRNYRHYLLWSQSPEIHGYPKVFFILCSMGSQNMSLERKTLLCHCKHTKQLLLWDDNMYIIWFAPIVLYVRTCKIYAALNPICLHYLPRTLHRQVQVNKIWWEDCWAVCPLPSVCLTEHSTHHHFHPKIITARK